MGIVLKQSFRNTLVIYLSFLVGALNNIFFYPNYLGGEYQGIIMFLFSYSNLIMPLTAFGIHFTIVKFFSSYQSKKEKDKFLTFALIFPLLIAFIVGFFWNYVHQFIVSKLSIQNAKVESYTIAIYILAVSCAYFEVFYSWAKVHLQTVFGNILKEFWNRATVCLLLLAVVFKWITKPEFIYIVTVAYVLRTLVMMVYSLRIYMPKITLSLPSNFSEILKYSGYIILAGSAGAILIDIDKIMIPDKEAIEKAAYYGVAVFIGSFIEAPGRAMNQILQPLTSKSLNENNAVEVVNLYKKSSINLLLIGGLFFLLVNCGVKELFKMMPQGYSGGELVVLMISSVKLYSMFLGNNVSIIQNSKFYRIALPIGVGSALGVYFLNKYFYFNLDLGTNGLALSTLLVIFLFNTFKLWFVRKKFNMSPFTSKSWQMVFVISILFGVFYFWNFSTPEFYISKFPIHPVINIILKSILIVVLYIFLVVKLKISDQINALIGRFVKL